MKYEVPGTGLGGFLISANEDPSLRIESFAIINYVVFPQS